jgi:hypothetical protein
MQQHTSVFLAEGIVIGAALILVAVLVLVFSPLLWTDHLFHNTNQLIPAGCTITTPLTNGSVGVAHCPVWANWQPAA